MKQLWNRQPIEIRHTILAAVLVLVIVSFFYFVKFEGNITGFFRIGSLFPISPYLNSDQVLIYQGEQGYDGQQFLSIALDPWLENSGTIEAITPPQYRYRRILYPLLGYLLGFGNPQLIPYAMVGINCLAIILIVFVSSLYFKRYSGKNWHSLLVLSIPGIWMVLSLSTADLISSLLLVTAIYFYRNEKAIYTAIAIAAACLTRETMLLMWLAILLTSIWERKGRQLQHLLWAWIPVAGWAIYVFYHLEAQENLEGSENFGYPLFGIGQKLINSLTGGLGGKNLFEAYSFALLIAAFLVTILLASQSLRENKVILISAIIYAVLFSMTSMTILGYYLDYSRVYLDIYFLLLLSTSYSQRYLSYLKNIVMAGASLASITYLLAHS
ncbi:AZOBR_p60025 family cell surface glycopolymer formation protein [Moorena producens]|uniref:AZOBR_p60025 family cell surface glycopolymer formation protein n=1 Tax=Moorena producens TaxID=1155739 RepID=UPI003C70987E